MLITFGFHAENSEENNEMTSSESFKKIITELKNIKYQNKLIIIIWVIWYFPDNISTFLSILASKFSGQRVF